MLAELIWQTPPTAPDRLRLVYAGQVLTLDATELAAARDRVRARCEATRHAAQRRPADRRRRRCVDALWSKVDGAHLDRELFVDEVARPARVPALPRRLVAAR